jgi:hypothetical protein
MVKVQVYFFLTLSIILLIIACEEDMLRNNQYDPGSDNTIIGSIAGFVSPSSSNALVSAKRGSNIYESTIIESDGKFELTNLPEGIYTIVVEANNFLTDSSLTNIQVIPKVNFSVGTVYINSAIHGTISGKVEPYNSSVQIILIKDGSESQSTNLNEKSEFNFSMLDPGIYEIQISLSGYSTFENSQINVTAGITTNLSTIILNDISKGSVTGFVYPKSSSAIVFLYNGSTEIDSILIDPLTGQYLFTNLEPSTYDILVTADGYAIGELYGIVVLAGETNEGNNLLLEETGSIKGSVYPISSNALVEAHIGEEIILYTYINSTDGSYTLQDLSPDYYNLVITADGRITDENFVNVRVEPGQSTVLDRVYLASSESNAIYGRVVSQSTENSIGGALLTIESATSTTDVEGYYVFYSLSSGNKNVQIEKDGYLSTISSVVVPETGTTKTNFTMVSAGSLSGQITDSQTGIGINGARISIDNDDYVTFTNSSGDYSFEGLSEGNHNAIASKSGYHSSNGEITIISGVLSSLDFSLLSLDANTGTLSGNVKNIFTDENITDAIILISGMADETDYSGYYLIHNILEGEHSISVSHTDYFSDQATVSITAGSEQSHNFYLTPSDSADTLPTGTVSGTMINSYTGELITSTDLTGYLRLPDNSMPGFFQFNGDGTFQVLNNLPNTDNYQTYNIPAGEYNIYLLASNADYVNSLSTYFVVVEGVNDLECTLTEYCSLSGTVYDATTFQPISGAFIIYMSVTTDENDNYFKGSWDPYFSYEHWVNKDGYYYEEHSAPPLIPGHINIINFYLRPLPFVEGYITDSNNGSFLSNVEITSSDASGATSDESGYYKMIYQNEGDTQINFAREGYYNYSTALNVPHTGSISLNVELDPN